MRKKNFFIKLVWTVIVLATLATHGSSASQPVTVTDLAGRTVTLEAPVRSVVATFNMEEYLAVAGDEALGRLVGWSRGYWEGRRQWTWRKYVESNPTLETVPDVGYVAKNSFSAEMVIASRPDLVIMYIGYLTQAAAEISQFERAGIPVIFLDYHSSTLETHVRSTLLLGRVLGQEQRAQSLVALYEAKVRTVLDRVSGIDERAKPKVYIEAGSGGPDDFGNTYGNVMWGALVKQAGGINITEGKIDRWGPIHPEFVIAADPDIIIITGSFWPKNDTSMKLGYYAEAAESQARLRAFIERPGWPLLRAVQNSHVYAIHHGLSRHIFDFVALRYFASIFHPETFKDLNPVHDFEAFHNDYLPVDYSGLWMMRLAKQD